MSKEQAKEFFEAISKDKKLNEEVKDLLSGQATNEEKTKGLLSLAKRHNFNFTEDELKTSLSIDDLADVSGGMWSSLGRLGLSVLNMFGIGGGGNQPAPQPDVPIVNVQQVNDNGGGNQLASQPGAPIVNEQQVNDSNVQNTSDSQAQEEDYIGGWNADELISRANDLEQLLSQLKGHQDAKKLTETVENCIKELFQVASSNRGNFEKSIANADGLIKEAKAFLRSKQEQVIAVFKEDELPILISWHSKLLTRQHKLKQCQGDPELLKEVDKCYFSLLDAIGRKMGDFDYLNNWATQLINKSDAYLSLLETKGVVEHSSASLQAKESQADLQHKIDVLNEIVQRNSVNNFVSVVDWLKEYDDIKRSKKLTPTSRKENEAGLFEKARKINQALNASGHPLFIHPKYLKSGLKNESADKRAERIKGILDVFSQKWSSYFLHIDDESDEIKLANQMQECKADLADKLTTPNVIKARGLLKNFLDWLYPQVEAEYDSLVPELEECDDDSKVPMSDALRLYLDMEVAFDPQGQFGDRRLLHGTNSFYKNGFNDRDRSFLTEGLTAARELLINSAPRVAVFDDVRGVTGVDVSGVDGEFQLAVEIQEFLNTTGGNFSEEHLKTMDAFLDRARGLLLQRACAHTKFDSDQKDIHRNDLKLAQMLGIDGQYVQEKVKKKMTKSHKDINGSITLANGTTVSYHFYLDSGTLLLTGSGDTKIGPNGESEQSFSDSLWWQLRNKEGICFSALDGWGNYAVDQLPTTTTPFVVRNLIIGDGISEIGDNAFCDQLSLRSVYFLGKVHRVGRSAFARDEGAYDISILEVGFAYPAQLKDIGVGVFEGNTKLTSSNMCLTGQ